MTDENILTPDAEEQELLDIGWLEVCLNVKSLAKSIEFYEKLGFIQAFGEPENGWVIMESEQAVIALYEGHLEGNLYNFRGGDIQKIADTLKAEGVALKAEVSMEEDGSLGCIVEDPDGNLLHFNTHPDDLEDDECCCDDEECTDETCECGHEHHEHGEEEKK